MNLCEDCPPGNYPTDKTRCLPCPRRKGFSVGQMARFNHEADIPPQPVIDLGFDYRCDYCDSGLQAEWDFCPFCGLCQREQPSGLCLAGVTPNKACRPDDLTRCMICGFVVDM